MKEVWRDVTGYEGFYKVSNLGNVKTTKRSFLKTDKTICNVKEKILKPWKDSRGYMQVKLYKNFDKKIKMLHRIVLEAFEPNVKNLEQVNHKDENPLNNKLENLEWCTREYNMNYGNRIKKISKPVLQFNKENEFMKRWRSAREAEKNGYCSVCICYCCKGKIKTHKGFIWKYE